MVTKQKQPTKAMRVVERRLTAQAPLAQLPSRSARPLARPPIVQAPLAQLPEAS